MKSGKKQNGSARLPESTYKLYNILGPTLFSPLLSRAHPPRPPYSMNHSIVVQIMWLLLLANLGHSVKDPNMADFPEYNSQKACAKSALTWASFNIGCGDTNPVAEDTCLCNNFGEAVAEVSSGVSRSCTSTADIAFATSFLYMFCSQWTDTAIPPSPTGSPTGRSTNQGTTSHCPLN